MPLEPDSPILSFDTSKMVGDLKRITEQVDSLTARARKLLGFAFAKDNMNPLFEGGGFFCRRDTASLNAIMAGMRAAFYAGYRRSDYPAPSEEKCEAAFQHWVSNK